jgi:tetratricopeptide (TPR) repeat protein
MRRLPLAVCLALCLAQAAQASAQASVRPGKTNFDRLYLAAQQARDENRDNDAIGLLRKALLVRPESEEVLWYLGTLLYEKEKYAETREILRRFLTLRPAAGPGWAFLGLSEFQMRQYKRALEHLDRARACGLGDRKELSRLVVFDQAILLTRAERFDESMDLLVKLLTDVPPDASMVEAAGLAGLRLPLLPAEIPVEDRKLVEQAGWAVIALEMHNNNEAEAAFEKLLADYPNQPGVHFLAGAYRMQRSPEQAISEFEQELRISPSHVLARVRMAEQLLAQREPDRALGLAREAILLDPGRASAHMLAGEALLQKGDAPAGIKELETAREADPELRRAHMDLFRTYAAAGRKDDAAREKEQIDRLFQSNTTTHLGDPDDVPHD